MDPLGELGSKNLIDGAMRFHSAFAGERIGLYDNAEMGFAALPPAGMAMMLRTFVQNLKAERVKSRTQLVFDAGFVGGHSRKPLGAPI